MRDLNPGPSALEADALTTRPTRRYAWGRFSGKSNLKWNEAQQTIRQAWALYKQIKRNKKYQCLIVCRTNTYYCICLSCAECSYGYAGQTCIIACLLCAQCSYGFAGQTCIIADICYLLNAHMGYNNSLPQSLKHTHTYTHTLHYSSNTHKNTHIHIYTHSHIHTLMHLSSRLPWGDWTHSLRVKH